MSEPLAEPILYEMHMHTPLCKHARGEPEDYAAAARGRGLKGIVVTCHNPTNDGWSPGVRMSVAEFEDYLAMVERARTTWSGRVDVRLRVRDDHAEGVGRVREQALVRVDDGLVGRDALVVAHLDPAPLS